MHYTQNQKLEQVTEKTLVIGVDIGSESHHARAFNYRGIEYSSKDFEFGNNAKGFEAFQGWTQSYVLFVKFCEGRIVTINAGETRGCQVA